MRPTIRVRLTLWWALLFLGMAALLQWLGYVLVSSQLDEAPADIRTQVAADLGLPPSTLDDLDQPDAGRLLPGGATVVELLDNAYRQATDDALDHIRGQARTALLILAGLAGGAGWFLSGRLLAPIRRITATARTISDSNLEARLALDGPDDELRELADAFDAMLGRLDRAFRAQQAFAARASHELRTPLTLIRAELDVTLDDPDPTRDDLASMATEIRTALARSEQLVDHLLLLARTADVLPAHRPVDLADLAAAAVNRHAATVDETGLQPRLELAPAPVVGDPVLLEQLVDNLVGNAIIHNVPGGWLTIATAAAGRHTRLTVANSGTPLAPSETARLTEPFYRPETSRGTPGSGLGLAIVDAITATHGGTLTLRTGRSGGLEATVTLPRPPASG